jgi:nitroreductase
MKIDLSNSVQEFATMGQFGMNETRTLMRSDWEPTAFSARVVEPEKLRCLLEGANQTPSHLNEQPWYFIIASRDYLDEYERLLSCLATVNVEWAQRAPILMLSVVSLNNGSNGGRNNYAFRDAGHAVSNLVLRANAMGLAAHQMAGFDAAKARERFQIPAGFAPTTVIALGYLTDLKGLSAATQIGDARTDRPLESFVFTGSWGRPSPLINEAAQEASRNDSDCLGNRERSSAVA